MKILENKVAIVTGGANGIGKSIAWALDREGAKVVIADLAEALEISLKDRDFSSRFTFIQTDVSQKKQIVGLVDKVLDKFARIDILVNNAGICETCPTEELTESQWDRMMQVNLKGVFLMCQAVIPTMKKQCYGKIINISSVAAKMGGLLVGAHYSASKAGVLCLTKRLAREFASFGIHVNAVCPALVHTKMAEVFSSEDQDKVVQGIPLKKIGTPQDIAEAVVFLASDRAGYITGETINVDGGSLME